MLDKKDPKIKELNRKGWGKFSLSLDRIKYAALDACLGFEIIRKHHRLVGYDSYADHLNVVGV